MVIQMMSGSVYIKQQNLNWGIQIHLNYAYHDRQHPGSSFKCSKICWIEDGDGRRTIQRSKKEKKMRKTLSPQEEDTYNDNH